MCVLFYLYVLMIGNNSQIHERNKNYIGSSLGELSKSVTLQEINSFKRKLKPANTSCKKISNCNK